MSYKSGSMFISEFCLFLIITKYDETLHYYAYEIGFETKDIDFTRVTHGWLGLCAQIA